MQFATLITLASVTLALNLEQVRLINDNELIIQDAEYGYPTIINLKDEDDKVEEEGKKDKKTSSISSFFSSLTKTSSSSSSTTTSSSSTTKITTTTHSEKTHTTTDKHGSTSYWTKTKTYSITKTGGAEAVQAAAVGGPLLMALGLLL
ncbi:uncharacterized protein KGF55_001113 [Candida pseudojiufengensis]|uniref:uncharacterized protein n=1 Tax=Candida pseudojiufengensis TaxID=497109 RepID=UPI0022246E58|nr:uncharacterized protein KGF55_001113 [Candida pseudojiufengensis]KAI5965750.1 hypothetical protein KGF55_001113 [Candida pseudojiufengensis]